MGIRSIYVVESPSHAFTGCIAPTQCEKTPSCQVAGVLTRTGVVPADSDTSLIISPRRKKCVPVGKGRMGPDGDQWGGQRWGKLSPDTDHR